MATVLLLECFMGNNCFSPFIRRRTPKSVDRSFRIVYAMFSHFICITVDIYYYNNHIIDAGKILKCSVQLVKKVVYFSDPNS